MTPTAGVMRTAVAADLCAVSMVAAMEERFTRTPSMGDSSSSTPASPYSGTSSESKQMLQPRWTERLLRRRPEAPPSSKSAEVFWKSGSTATASSRALRV